MPTPVSVARQCLTPESAHALDEAVSVARRRGHAQTTSLHAISALLSLPSSSLRDACSRARNASYSPRLQFKALELCLSVSLDRVPSSQLTDEPPPVSNSLMAAIKRSQANQRRQPENFHLYHQLSNQSSSINAVKVELQHLILSILDDPVVSRVFGEAGFRSSEIKMAIIRPLPHLFRYANRPRMGPPMFLCNLTDPGGVGFINRGGFGAGKQQRGFNFPFSVGFPDAVDENCRRIGEVLGRVKGRNPMLVGVCAYDALKRFLETLEKREDCDATGTGTGTGFLPAEIEGVRVLDLESEVGKLVEESGNSVDGKFEELGKFVRECSGSGCLVSIGDLRLFVEDLGDERVRCVVDWLTRLFEVNSGKVWLIGAVGGYEVYTKFSSKFPTVEKDWDLHLLPITSHRPAMAESCPKSSLMESFVPFAGFFSTSSELSGPVIRSPYQSFSQYNLSREKWEPEVVAASKGGFTTSVADKYQHSLSSWMQMTEMGKKKSNEKTDDNELVQSTKSSGSQKESGGDCQQSRSVLRDNNVSRLQTVAGFDRADENRKTSDYQSKAIASPYETRCISVNSCTSTESQQFSSSCFGIHLARTSSSKNEGFLSKLLEKPSDTEDANSSALGSPNCSGSSLSLDGNRTSPASTTSAMTSLGLGLCYPPDINESKNTCRNYGSCFKNSDLFTKSVSKHLVHSSSLSAPGRSGPSILKDYKMFYSALRGKIDWQDEALSFICQTIVERQTSNENRQLASARGDIWFTFMGPDRIGKRKVAVALSEIIYGSQDHFVYIDLSSQDGLFNLGNSFDPGMNGYDLNYRGKTIVDVIAGELSKKPMSIMFLENVDKADEQVQSSLFQAFFTGKFLDSHGRHVGVNNTIFVTSTSLTKEEHVLSSRKDCSKYSEEAVLGVRHSPMMILVEAALRDAAMMHNQPESVKPTSASFSHMHANKRKLATSNENLELCETSEVTKRANKLSGMRLDLNLPADSDELLGSNDETTSDDVISDNARAWLLDFISFINATVVFKPYDFDSLAEKISKKIKESFRKIVGSECILEIDLKVMEQLLSAAYASDDDKVWEDWMGQVLNREFSEVQRRYMLTPNSIVRLLSHNDGSLEEQPSRVALPSRIILTDIHA